MRANRILKAPMAGPDDVAGVRRELAAQETGLEQVNAVMCMTEGDGFARGFASLAFANLFHEELGWPVHEVASRVPLIMIGGCSGLISPYAALFVDDDRLKGDGDRGGLAIGLTTTPDIEIEAFGTTDMVATIADAVRVGVEQAGIDRLEDVHNVQIKAPWPSTSQLLEAKESGKTVATLNGDHAGALARGAGALGVAVALNEINGSSLKDQDVGVNWDLQSNIASASAGTERTNVAVIVLGNSRESRSPYRIGHGVLKDGIDVAGVHRALASAGVDADSPLPPTGKNPVDHVFVKSAVELAGRSRGRRHVLQSDYLGAYSWLIAKAVIHATVAGVVGDPLMQVSGGGEHQGPPGGGLVAVVASR